MAPRKKSSNTLTPIQYPSGTNNSVTVNDFFNKEWRDYVIYTISNRAIPSVIDGLKPSQRKAVYCAKRLNRFIKVSGLTGATMTDGNYHHGDASMSDTIVGLTAPYQNNIPLLDKDGNFGSRLIRSAGAPRYISANISKNFTKYFNDFHILPKADDPEDPEPAYYLPIIPWVLINGVSGIATAYATDIPRYNVGDVKAMCKAYVSGKSIDKYELLPYYEDFQGSFKKVGNKVVCMGKVNRLDAHTLEILDIPLKFDHPTYIAILNKLKENGTIFSYDDESSAGRFKFKVHLKKSSGASIGRGSTLSDDQIVKLFKLEMNVKVNLNVLDENNNLIQFKSPIEIIKYFCDFRMKTITTRIATNLADVNKELERQTEKLKFIKLVVDGKIKFKNQNRADIIEQMKKANLKEEYFPYLLDIKIYNLTTDSITNTQQIITDLQTEKTYWESTDNKTEYLKDLASI